MRKKLIVVGAGGLGREVMWQIEASPLESNQYEILGFVDDNPNLQDKKINGYDVVGTLDWLRNIDKEICVVLAIGSAEIRKKIYDSIKQNTKLLYPNITAPGVKISSTVKCGKGCIFCLNTTATVNIRIGDFFIANPQCTIGHDCNIHSFVTLYPGVNVSGNVEIFEITEIGTGSQIIQGKSIGNNSIIGAGTVVIRDIPSNCTAVGVPARIVKQR